MATDMNLELDRLVEAVEDNHDLYAQSAAEAARVLVRNWKSAIRDGTPLADLITDVGEVVMRLGDFKESLLALRPKPPPAKLNFSTADNATVPCVYVYDVDTEHTLAVFYILNGDVAAAEKSARDFINNQKDS